MNLTQQTRDLLGVGLRVPHYRDFMQGPQACGWLEVHSENYFADGGLDLHVLEHLRRDYPLSLHGVGLALGSACEQSTAHLQRLKRLQERVQPRLVSEHLSWAMLPGRHLNDLLPMPLDQEALQLMAERIDLVQNFLGRQILIENVSTYLRFAEDSMSEAEFLANLVKRTGCGLLLDLNNLVVNQHNLAEDPQLALQILAQLPAGSVQEIHLAGHKMLGQIAVDDHGSRVADTVWQLFTKACLLFGVTTPVLLEWDTEIPDLSVILQELERAGQLMQSHEQVCAEVGHE